MVEGRDGVSSIDVGSANTLLYGKGKRKEMIVYSLLLSVELSFGMFD